MAVQRLKNVPTQPPEKDTEPSTDWLAVIDQHVAYQKTINLLWDKIQKFYEGEPWAATTVGESEAELRKTSTNFIFPTVQTAMGNLVSADPSIKLDPLNYMNPESPEQAQAAETLARLSLRAGKWREEQRMTVFHTVTKGRGIVKTFWDFEKDLPRTRFVNPRNYFFDQTAERFEDIKYESEATILSPTQMRKKVEAGLYPSDVLSRTTGAVEQYPTWMLPKNHDRNGARNLRNYTRWYLVYEVYDRENGVTHHYTPGRKEPIFTDEIFYRPYDMLVFSPNGENCGGISEIGLLLANQENYNWIATFLLAILRASVPTLMYDGRVTSMDEEAKKVSAPIGARVPVKVPDNKSLSDMYMNSPMPQVPQNSWEMLNNEREAMAFVSALNASQRGQITGAKTATEMEFLKDQLRGLVEDKVDAIEQLTADVAAKHVLLASKMMTTEKVWRPQGPTGPRLVANPHVLEGVTAGFIAEGGDGKTNKAVKIETLRNIQPLLQNNPWVKQRAFTARLFELLDLGDEDLLYTDEEVAQNAAAAKPAGGEPQPGAEGPAPSAPPTELPPNPSTPLDPNPGEPGAGVQGP